MFWTGIRRTVLAFTILTTIAAGCGGRRETQSLQAVEGPVAPANAAPSPSIPSATAAAPTPGVVPPSTAPIPAPSEGRPAAPPSKTPDAAASELAQIDGLLKAIDGALSDFDAAVRTGE